MNAVNSVLRYSIFIILSALLNGSLQAEELPSTQPDNPAAASQLSVAQNIANMDKDRDGIVTVYEVRSFIESKHGKHYKTEVLDDMESSAAGKSCSSPFAKSLY